MLSACEETADAAEALGEGAGNEVDLVFDAKGFREASTRFSHDSEAVGVIQKEEGAVALHHFAELIEGGDIPEHAVEAFHDDQGPGAAVAEATQALV